MKYEREQITFTNSVVFNLLPTKINSQFVAGVTTPSVANCEFFIALNTIATTITDFTNGNDQQVISILGDGFTSISNSTKIKTNTGALKLLAANKVYRFTRFNDVWYEDA